MRGNANISNIFARGRQCSVVDLKKIFYECRNLFLLLTYFNLISAVLLSHLDDDTHLKGFLKNKINSKPGSSVVEVSLIS